MSDGKVRTDVGSARVALLRHVSGRDANSSLQETQLARIRDNQRRSRARRKEYLQELETKLRNCEQLGVEASTEIQAAARRVLDENKRLRALLKEKGVSEVEIDAFSVDLDESVPQETPSIALWNMMSSAKPCDGSSPCGSGTWSPREGSSRQAMTHQPLARPSALSQVQDRSKAMAASDQSSHHNEPSYDPLHHNITSIPGQTAQSPTHSRKMHDEALFGESNNLAYGAQNDLTMNYSSYLRPNPGTGLEVGSCCQGPTIDCALGNNIGYNVMDLDTLPIHSACS